MKPGYSLPLRKVWIGVVCIFFALLPFITSAAAQGNPAAPFLFTKWQSFYAEENGLPNDHIFALKSDGDKLWVGTEGGLALYQNGNWKSWTEKEGLPWNIIISIAVSEKTGDIWLGSLGGGLIRFSGGRFDQFTQMNSGLVNDVLYGVAVTGDEVWVATTAGVNRYNYVKDEWEIFTEKNSPMEEIWCYNIDAGENSVHVAVWGGGILVWDKETQRWDAHRDPDKEMEMDLLRDDGLIHNITTAVSFVDETMWASSYFGLSRYDGRKWRGYMDHDSGLVSNFINFAVGKDKNSCYLATDKGLSILADYPSDTWVTYKREKEDSKTWTAHITRGKKQIGKRKTDLTLPNGFVIAVAEHQGEIWLGTGHGLAKTVRSKN